MTQTPSNHGSLSNRQKQMTPSKKNITVSYRWQENWLTSVCFLSLPSWNAGCPTDIIAKRVLRIDFKMNEKANTTDTKKTSHSVMHIFGK